MKPSIRTTFKDDEEEYENKLITIDFMRFTGIKKIKNVFGYRRSILVQHCYTAS